MKKNLQSLFKLLFDVIVLPFLFIFVIFVRFFIQNNSKPRVLFCLMHNNNLIYIRDALIEKGYHAKVIPWMIPANEIGVIDYNLDVSKSFPKLYKNFFGQLIMLYAFFFYSVLKFDVFIMPFQNRLLDRTFILAWIEFQFLKIARKKIILSPYGGDIQHYQYWKDKKNPSLQELYKAYKKDPLYSKVPEKFVRKNTKYCLKWADKTLVAIDWPDYLPKGDYEYFHMRCMPPINRVKIRNKKKPFQIVHATNHEHFKGTKYLRKAVSDLKKENYKIELNILKGASHNVVLKKINQADVVFDQLLYGAYGRLAIEAMALEKPVLCYLRPELLKLYPYWSDCPIINVNTDTLKREIRKLILMKPNARNNIGLGSRKYVDKYHSREFVSNRLDNIINALYP